MTPQPVDDAIVAWMLSVGEPKGDEFVGIGEAAAGNEYGLVVPGAADAAFASLLFDLLPVL